MAKRKTVTSKTAAPPMAANTGHEKSRGILLFINDAVRAPGTFAVFVMAAILAAMVLVELYSDWQDKRFQPFNNFNLIGGTDGDLVLYRVEAIKVTTKHLEQCTAAWVSGETVERTPIYDANGEPTNCDAVIEFGEEFVTRQFRVLVPTFVLSTEGTKLRLCFTFDSSPTKCYDTMYSSIPLAPMGDPAMILDPIQPSLGGGAPRRIAPLPAN